MVAEVAPAGTTADVRLRRTIQGAVVSVAVQVRMLLVCCECKAASTAKEVALRTTWLKNVMAACEL